MEFKDLGSIKEFAQWQNDMAVTTTNNYNQAQQKEEVLAEDERVKVVKWRDRTGCVRFYNINKGYRSPIRHHQFDTLSGFTEYLMSKHCEKNAGILFVERDRVIALLDYGAPYCHTASLPLSYAPEFSLLLRLGEKPISQKDLWRLLVTDLDGCFPKNLLLQISAIRKAIKGDSENAIHSTGLVDSSVRMAVRLSWKNPAGQEQEADLDCEWGWSGRIYECFPFVSCVETRLEIQESPLGFIFHPRRLREVMDTTRLELVNELRTSVGERFEVYEGNAIDKRYPEEDTAPVGMAPSASVALLGGLPVVHLSCMVGPQAAAEEGEGEGEEAGETPALPEKETSGSE